MGPLSLASGFPVHSLQKSHPVGPGGLAGPPRCKHGAVKIKQHTMTCRTMTVSGWHRMSIQLVLSLDFFYLVNLLAKSLAVCKVPWRKKGHASQSRSRKVLTKRQESLLLPSSVLQPIVISEPTFPLLCFPRSCLQINPSDRAFLRARWRALGRMPLQPFWCSLFSQPYPRCSRLSPGFCEFP